MTKRHGFTLIELMIVLAIMGIIASFAIPIYADYLQRAKLSEAVKLLGGLKNPAAEYFYFHGHWPATVASVGGRSIGLYTSILVMGQNTAAQNYWVEATMRGNRGSSGIYGRKLRFYFRINDREWECSNEGIPVDEAVSHQYLPGVCSN